MFKNAAASFRLDNRYASAPRSRLNAPVLCFPVDDMPGVKENRDSPQPPRHVDHARRRDELLDRIVSSHCAIIFTGDPVDGRIECVRLSPQENIPVQAAPLSYFEISSTERPRFSELRGN